MKLQVQVTVDEYDLRHAVIAADHETAIEAVMAIDLGIADVGFTEELIRKLIASCRVDWSDKEFSDFIKSIAGEAA